MKTMFIGGLILGVAVTVGLGYWAIGRAFNNF